MGAVPARPVRLIVLAGCGDDEAAKRQEATDLVRTTTALVREVRDDRTERTAPPALETIETDGGTIVIAIWPGGEHEIWRVGKDGSVVSVAYRNEGESMRRTEDTLAATRTR